MQARFPRFCAPYFCNLTPLPPSAIPRNASGDVLQGAAADCNSAGETHAWFDSRVAHHFPQIMNRPQGRTTRRVQPLLSIPWNDRPPGSATSSASVGNCPSQLV
jgi:hypothetical protein